jgi:hypothetical protein
LLRADDDDWTAVEQFTEEFLALRIALAAGKAA